ncbi:MAG TPA: Gfo/Idh/MocA family oxidoreductase, partial [Aestuariivirga sp.]|nr:Gfo/Idh/MocA family oxidoreductase [Aestuariivirga sp.]
MNNSPLRAGVIGCGFFAENHLAAWAEIEGVTLAAVCDLDIAKARSAAGRHGAKSVYSNAADLLE